MPRASAVFHNYPARMTPSPSLPSGTRTYPPATTTSSSSSQHAATTAMMPNSYVGKSSSSGTRRAFILDCGEQVDEVLLTLAQAFNLAVAKRRKPAPKKPPPSAPELPARAAASKAPDLTEVPEEVCMQHSIRCNKLFMLLALTRIHARF